MGRKLKKTHLRLTIEINAAIQCRRFSPAETCVLHAIIGGTYGTFDWKAKEAKDRAEFTLDALVADTGLYRGQVHEALKSLAKDKILRVYREGAPRIAAVYGVEDHTDLWTRPTNASLRRLRSENPDHTHSRKNPTIEQSENPDRVKSENPDRKQGVFPTVTSKQSGTVKPKKASVDHVDLPLVDVDQPNLPSKKYDKVLHPISPIPVTREQREAIALSDYIRLDDYTVEQKLEALVEGVAQTQAYIAGKKGITGPFVCWAISKALKHLAALTPEPTPDEAQADYERQVAEWNERQEQIRKFRRPNEDPEEAKALGQEYRPRPEDAQPSTPLRKFSWSPRQPDTGAEANQP